VACLELYQSANPTEQIVEGVLDTENNEDKDIPKLRNVSLLNIRNRGSDVPIKNVQQDQYS
jgi:hypothetical protein